MPNYRPSGPPRISTQASHTFTSRSAAVTTVTINGATIASPGRLRSFWLDHSCGPGSTYVTRGEGYTKLGCDTCDRFVWHARQTATPGVK